MPDVDHNQVLTVEEAAELLRVKPWTVRNEAREGRLPARKIGKEWRFSREGLLEWLKGDPDQAYFWTARWQQMEREADEAIARGEVDKIESP